MSTEPLKKFTELSNFQQWVLFYLTKNGSMRTRVEDEINNFCDTTKDKIDLNNYEQDISSLQAELLYFHKKGIIRDTGQGQFVLSTKGDIYCFQNLNKNLGKLSMQNVVTKIKATSHYMSNRGFIDLIISNYQNLKVIAQIVIGDAKLAMTNIQTFVLILEILQDI